MDRRQFLQATAAGLLAAPFAAEAQPAGKVYRIAYLANGTPTTSVPAAEGFRQGLRELGWVEGQNVTIEYRWADGNLDRLPALAAELLRAPVDVIVVAGGPGVRAARQASPTVPIVAAVMGDVVAAGFARSLARPGGNLTGGTVQFEELATKQLQILKETVPNATRIAILDDPGMHNTAVRKAAESAAMTLGLKARAFGSRDESELEGAFRAAKVDRAGAGHSGERHEAHPCRGVTAKSRRGCLPFGPMTKLDSPEDRDDALAATDARSVLLPRPRRVDSLRLHLGHRERRRGVEGPRGFATYREALEASRFLVLVKS